MGIYGVVTLIAFIFSEIIRLRQFSNWLIESKLSRKKFVLYSYFYSRLAVLERNGKPNSLQTRWTCSSGIIDMYFTSYSVARW